MIIPSPTSPKSPLVIKDQDEAEGSVAPPPAYGAVQESQPLLSDHRSSQGSQPSGSDNPADPLLAAEAGERQSSNHNSKKGRWRYCHLLFWAILAAILLAFILTKVLSHRSPPDNSHFSWIENGTYSVPEGVKLTACHDAVRYTSGSSSAMQQLDSSALESVHGQSSENSYSGIFQHTYRVPFASDNRLFVLSAGASQVGEVSIVTSSVLDDVMQVNVNFVQSAGQDPNLVRVCTARRGRKDLGVVILTPNDLPFPSFAIMHTQIVLPQFTDTPIKAFEGVFEQHDVHVQDVGQVEFDDFSLKASNRKIKIDALHAKTGVVRAENGPIEGSFITSGSLELRTSNAPIQAFVEASSRQQSSPFVRMVTNNKPVNLDLSLNGDKKTDYNVDVKTTNARMDIHVHSQPLGSKLFLSGESSNGPINADLDSGFEGDFKVTSFNFKELLPDVKYHEDENDPAGQGRQRRVELDYRRPSTMSGAIFWGDSRPKDKGQITLRTTLRPIEIHA